MSRSQRAEAQAPKTSSRSRLVALVEPGAVPRGSDSTELRDLVWKSAEVGIELCRRGLWKGGITQLRLLEARKGGGQAIPGLALSYFGYGIASVEGRINEGIRYCRAGVDREIWRAENHLNLARTYLLAGRVRPAVEALDYGLGLEPYHPGILELRHNLGVRRRPMFPFLDRSHPINRFAGRLRHQLSRSIGTRAADPEPSTATASSDAAPAAPVRRRPRWPGSREMDLARRAVNASEVESIESEDRAS
jgi:hypothetical protein